MDHSYGGWRVLQKWKRLSGSKSYWSGFIKKLERLYGCCRIFVRRLRWEPTLLWLVGGIHSLLWWRFIFRQCVRSRYINAHYILCNVYNLLYHSCRKSGAHELFSITIYSGYPNIVIEGHILPLKHRIYAPYIPDRSSINTKEICDASLLCFSYIAKQVSIII